MTERYAQWQVERVGEVDSTNRVAADRVRAAWEAGKSAAGTVIVAERQSAGRGQHGRRWESPAGGLYLSAVVEAVASPWRDKLALVAGVAAAEGVRLSERIQPRLRWPNDLMLGGKKVGGILCEGLAEGQRWAGIIGVGINVNTQVEDLPTGLRQRTTSLLAEDGRRHDAGEVERRLLGELAEGLRQLAEEGCVPVIGRVRQLDDLKGKRITFDGGGEPLEGTACGIGDLGELLIHLDHGPLRGFLSGSVLAVDGVSLRQ
jgi:BirA family biotin operon repressor/biotin-[acetyl-CoA-carboxylase] ligase